jgi:hypothetical protein
VATATETTIIGSGIGAAATLSVGILAVFREVRMNHRQLQLAKANAKSGNGSAALISKLIEDELHDQARLEKEIDELRDENERYRQDEERRARRRRRRNPAQQ